MNTAANSSSYGGDIRPAPAHIQAKLSQHLSDIYETPGAGKRILAMEGLRGLAILLVFLCHYKLVVLNRLSKAFDSTLFLTTVQIGATGVDLFFLLSGMLIYRAALRKDLQLGNFLSRRIRRIYPTFLVALAIYFAATVFLHQGEQRVPQGIGDGATYMTYNLLLLPGLADIRPLIPAAWSLSYEFCFYIAIPILAITLRMSHWTRLQRSLLWTFILVLHVVYVLALPETLPEYQYQDNNFLRFGMFLSGMLVFEILGSVRGAGWLTHRRQAMLSVVCLIAAAAYVFFVHATVRVEHPPIFHFVVKAVLIFFTYTSLALSTLVENGLWKSIFSFTPLRWLGNISYSFYLIHGLALNAVMVVILHFSAPKQHFLLSALILFPVSLLITVGVSTVLYLLVERPFSLRPSKKRLEIATV